MSGREVFVTVGCTARMLELLLRCFKDLLGSFGEFFAPAYVTVSVELFLGTSRPDGEYLGVEGPSCTASLEPGDGWGLC